MFLGQFTVTDVAGCLATVPGFVPFLLAPGFCIGYSLNLFRFREASIAEQLLLSTALSVGTTPFLASLTARFLPMSVVCWLFMGSLVIAAALFFTQLGKRPRHALDRATKIGLAMLALWVLVAIASLVDIQIGTRLYAPASVFDQSLRSAVTAAALRTGAPPANPFFFPGEFVPMRYYYYWNVVAALPAKLLGLSPRITMLGSVIWAGFALAAMIPLYLKHFCEQRVDLGKKSILGIALLIVTGLDLVPSLMWLLGEHTILVDMEWWDGVQVTSWLDSLLWVPHHICGALAALVGFLVLWVVPEDATLSDRAKAALVAGIAFASAAGLSLYVMFAFAIFLTIWTLVLLRSHLWRESTMFIAAGAFSIVISIAYLHDLQGPGFTGSFATFYVRALESMENWADNTIQHEWLKALFLAAMLPAYYLVELGFFALVGFVQAWRFWKRPEPIRKWEWASICLCGASLLVASFLMSTTGNNDLGYRSILLAQFVLLLWSVPYVYGWLTGPRGKRALIFQVFLLVGVLGTLYQLVELRSITYLVDRTNWVDDQPWLPKPEEVGRDLYLLRKGFTTLDAHLGQNAIVQYNPLNPVYVPNLYYSLHQAVAGQGVCGTAFGGDPFRCVPYQNRIVAAYNGRGAYSRREADELCNDLKIDVLVAEHNDRMWALKKSWVWSERPLVANAAFRAYACGANREQIERAFAPAH